MITVTQTKLDGVLIIEPGIYTDDRGSFYESFNSKEFKEKTGVSLDFVQDNHAVSKQNVLRGLHYQYQKPQGKLVRCIQGKILDVAVDLRKASSTFGQYVAVELSDENRLQLWVPPGFVHGVLTLSESSICSYKITAYQNPGDEYCLAWNDPAVNIFWPITNPILSEKDSRGLGLLEIPHF